MGIQAALLAALAAPIVLAYTTIEAKEFMMKNIDPIVNRGEYSAHMHTFCGSDAITKNMPSSADLRAGCSTAIHPDDLSSYWFSTLYHVKDGKHIPIPVKRFQAYYNFERTQAEIAIPENFSVIAGNSKATSQAEVVKEADMAWRCEDERSNGGGKEQGAWPQKPCKDGMLLLTLWFPECVNPDTLASAYSKDGGKTCGRGMKRMPQVRFSIRYDISSIGHWAGDPPLQLSCGKTSYCMHGDFINGWTPDAAEAMVKTLKDPKKREELPGDKKGSKCKGKAKDADPKGGTSDYDDSLKTLAP